MAVTSLHHANCYNMLYFFTDVDVDKDEVMAVSLHVCVRQVYDASRNHQVSGKPAAAAAAAVYGRLPAASTNDRRPKYFGLFLFHFTCSRMIMNWIITLATSRRNR